MTVLKRKPTDYTEGSIFQSILKMGLPSMFGFLAQHIYGMADTFWIAQLPDSETAVAAITFFNSLLWILFAFNTLIGPGSVAVISRRYGEKDYDNTERAIKETIILKLFFGALLGLFGWIFLRDLLTMLNASGETLEMGMRYGRIMIIFLPILYATYSIFTAMRGIANPAIAMILMISSNVLNILVDPLLIFGYLGFPALGLEGAAYASVGSYTLTFSVGLILFRTNWVNVKLHLIGKVPMQIKSMWQIVRIGIPAWLGDLSFSGSRMLIIPIVASFGDSVVAAYGVGIQLFAFGIMIIVGIGLGLSSLIGHNLGAEKFERAKTTANQALLLGMGVMTVMGFLTYFGAEFYLGLFFDAPETINYGIEMLRIWAIGFPAFGAFIMLEQIHSGVGLNTPYMIIAVIHGWVFQVLPAMVATNLLGFDQTAIWWALCMSGVLSAIIFYVYFRRGRWLTVKV